MNPSSVSIFGFTTFISALALLVIVYTVSDVRYRFRVAVTPIPLFGVTYFLIALLGFGTLIIDTWFAEHWLMPNVLSNQVIWQATFGVIFLSLALTWMYYAVIKPPIFRKNNHKKFADALYQAILKGSDTELPTIASELRRSALSIIKLAKESSHSSSGEPNRERKIKKRCPGVEDYAHDILLLIGNRKFCQHIVASSPMTAIAFFKSMTAEQKYDIPIGPFAKNISTEALVNKNSILYHEDEGYRSGLIGYVKPFSHIIYGKHRLVEALAAKHGSPLDVHHEVVWSWDGTQLKAYCRCVMLTWKNYIEEGNWDQHSFALCRAFEIIKDSCHDIYKLDASESYSTDIDKRLSVAVDFFKDAIEILDKKQRVPNATLRIRNNQQKSFYDYLVYYIFKLIFSASLVKSPPDNCWMIQHNTVWTAFFWSDGNDGEAWKIIRHKLRRKLYDEVCLLEKIPNYESSGVLGFLLNVMGLKICDRNDRNKSYYALHKATLRWVQNNYLILIDIQPDVAASCLIGSVSFDKRNSSLVKINSKGLNMEPSRECLDLNQHDNDK